MSTPYIPSPMTFESFQHAARLYVLGALEEEEMVDFEEARRDYGERRQMNSSRNAVNSTPPLP